MDTQGIGIHPDDGALQPQGTLVYPPPPPLRSQGQGEGGHTGNGIQRHRRVLAHPVPLAPVLSGARDGRGLPSKNTEWRERRDPGARGWRAKKGHPTKKTALA